MYLGHVIPTPLSRIGWIFAADANEQVSAVLSWHFVAEAGHPERNPARVTAKQLPSCPLPFFLQILQANSIFLLDLHVLVQS